MTYSLNIHKKKLLKRSYYLNEDVVFLAKDLLGKLILTNIEGLVTSAIITETEAYKAPVDKASHAYGMRRTKRTEVIFRKGGIAYVYLNYGIHHLFNVISGLQEIPHAVLVRAIVPVQNIHIQMQRRKKEGKSNYNKSIFNGPGKLSQALAITTKYNELDLCHEDSALRIYDTDLNFSEKDIIKGPRVGIDYAEEWVKKPWKFYLKEGIIEDLKILT